MTSISQNMDVLVPFTQGTDRRLHASEIARMLKKPQKTVQRKLEHLCRKGLLEYVRVGNNKHYFFDLDKTSSMAMLTMVESEKELQFLIHHPRLAVLFNELGTDTCVLLFGSYAKATEKKDSDLDLIIFRRKSKKLEAIIKRFPLEINAEFSSMAVFKRRLRQKQPLAIEIAKDHIIFGKKEEIIHTIFKRTEES